MIDSQDAWIGLTYTADGGDSWLSRLPPTSAAADFDLGAPPYAASTFFVTAARGWLTGLRSVWSTNDGGLTWRRDLPGHLHAVAMKGPRGWMGAGDGRVVENYTTDDFGATWKPCGYPWHPSEAAPWSSASFLDAAIGWVTIASYNERELPYLGGVAKTVDGGCTWNVLWRDRGAAAENLAGIQFVDSTFGWLFASYGRLLQTTDGGSHWKSVPLPNEWRLEGAFLISRTKGWILGSPGSGSGLCYTTDGGAHWHDVSKQEIRRGGGLASELPARWADGFVRALQLRRR